MGVHPNNRVKFEQTQYYLAEYPAGVDCVDFSDIRKKYFNCTTMSELFQVYSNR